MKVKPASDAKKGDFIVNKRNRYDVLKVNGWLASGKMVVETLGYPISTEFELDSDSIPLFEIVSSVSRHLYARRQVQRYIERSQQPSIYEVPMISRHHKLYDGS